MLKRIAIDGMRILTIYDAPAESDCFECVYGPFFKDVDISELEEMVIATKGHMRKRRMNV